MPSPLAALMGLASGAMGLLQRVMGNGNTAAGFEDQLKAALAGGPHAGNPLISKLMEARGAVNEDLLKALFANPQAIPLFQFLAALQSLGLTSSDAKALLLGDGQALSEMGLKAILASCGCTEADIAQVLADQPAIADLKAKLAGLVSDRLNQQFPAGGIDVRPLIETATADDATFGAVVAQFIVSKGFPQGVPGTPETEAAPLKTTPADIAKITSEIKKSVVSVLKGPETAPATATPAEATPAAETPATATPASPETVAATRITATPTIVAEASHAAAPAKPAPQATSSPAPAVASQVMEAADALENTFNVPKKVVQDLILATDPEVRKAAVDEATSRISEVLKANAGKDLPKGAVDALGLLRGTLTEEEFAGVENALKSSAPDLAGSLTSMPCDRTVFETLVKRHSDNPEAVARQSTREVLDQIKQALPSGLKASEGSMTLKLNPPMLGRVDIDIRMEDGKVMAFFKVDQPVTRDIIQQNMHTLKDALAEQGIKPAQFTVTTDTFNAREHREALAWFGADVGKGGSQRQGREQGSEGAARSQEEHGHGYAPVHRYGEAGGLDIFA